MRTLTVRSMAKWGAGFLGFALLLGLLAACSGEDRPGSVSVDPDSDTVSVSGTGSVTGTSFGAGEVELKPADAEQVNVSLAEWAITPDRTTVSAGKVYFLTSNLGPNDAHELVVIRTDLPPGDLSRVPGSGVTDNGA